MVDFSTAYQPPGVYVEEEQTPLIAVSGSAPTAVAIVGPGTGSLTFTETVTLNAEEVVSLTKAGIDSSTIAVTSLDGVTAYSLGVDYVLAIGGGADESLETLSDNTITIGRTPTGGEVETTIPDGASVVVSYRYADAEYYGPKRFTDLEDVKDYYGEPFDVATGTILSPLSMAARLAMANGAREVVLVATEGSGSLVTVDAINAALNKVATLFDVGVVVPLPVGLTGAPDAPGDVINVGVALALHLTTASEGGYQRIGIYGTETGSTIDAADIAAGINSRRVMLAHPNRMNFYNGFTNQVTEVAGYYLAAAYAGRLASLPVQTPLTKKSITGFAGIPADLAATMSQSVKNTWSAAGVAVAELTRQRTLVVRHGTSTAPASALTREISVTRAKDAMVRAIQETIDSSEIVGSALTDTSVIGVKGIVGGVLESMVDTGVIVSYRELKGRLRPGNPSVVEIKFEYRPAWPLNYIVISFSIDTSTGETDFDATLATEPAI